MELIGGSRERADNLRLRPAGGIGWWLGAALLLSAATDLRAQATPAGTVISSTAQATFEDPGGTSFTVLSNTAVFVVGQVAGVDLAPPRISTGDPGRTIVFTHTLQNIGNGLDGFTVAARCATGWPVTVYHDANGNGSLDPGDPAAAGPIDLAMGETAALLVAVTVPGLAAVRGVTDSVEVTTSSRFNATVTDTLQDLLQIRDVGIVVNLDKSVDRTSATPGDVLTYSIDYRAIGTESASNLRISDLVPLGSSYVAGTLRLNGASLSDVSGDDAGSFEAAANRVVVTLASVSGGDAGTVSFQVRVSP